MKAFQWIVWPYCNVGCEFCFLNGFKTKIDPQFQLNSLSSLNKELDTLNLSEYDTIGLIGGEMFQGQLADQHVRDTFYTTIERILTLYKEHKIDSVWLTASLIDANQDDLLQVFNMADKLGVFDDSYDNKKGIWLCTSYDIHGRFNKEENRETWKQNIKAIHSKYPKVKLNTTIILSQSFVDYFLDNKFNPREFQEEYATSLFYMQPVDNNLTFNICKDKEIQTMSTGCLLEYWKSVKENSLLKSWFFPKRDSFLQFLNKYYVEYPETYDKLFNIKYRADNITLNYSENSKNININREKNSKSEETFIPKGKCGHPITYSCYIDSDKCCLCDKESLESV